MAIWPTYRRFERESCSVTLYFGLRCRKMSNVEPIVISSDSGEDNDIIEIKECPNFRLSRSKLQALKSRKERKGFLRNTDSTSNNVLKNNGIPKSEKESPVKSSASRIAVRLNEAKFKRLKAVVRIELSPDTKRLPKISKTDDDALPLGIGSASPNKVYQSPGKSSPTQKNLQHYLTSSQHNHFKDTPDKITSPSKTPSPKTTPQKTQLSLNQWVTPSKKIRTQVSDTPINVNRTQVSDAPINVNAKRNELVWPPQHAILNTEQFITKLYKKKKSACEFPITYKCLLDSLQEEDLFISVVQALDSLMNRDFSPPADLIWFLVDIISSSRSDPWLISSTYSMLNDIIEKYPTKCIEMKVTWENIRKHFPGNGEKGLKIKVCSKLALSFLLSVLSVEVKATALKSRWTRLTKHFSADFHARHVKDVIPHLKKCLESHTELPNACSMGDEGNIWEETSICGLQLFQNLLKLFMIVSLNKEDAAIRLGDELLCLYIDLPNLQQRVLLLQSLMSLQVRQHLIRLLLMNCCLPLPEALPGHDIPLSMRKIILQDFYREPPKRSDGRCSYSTDAVEEYVTLLAYLLQSYVAMHSPILHGYHNDHPLCYHGDVREFSQEDLRYLKNLKCYVSDLHARCKSFLREGESLSVRTKLLLYVMKLVVWK